MEKYNLLNKQKSIFRNERLKWPSAHVCGHQPTYVGQSMRTQLGFQKYEKDKFSVIMAEVWNESHINWELFLFHYKKPYMVHFQNTQKSHKKNLRFTRKY